jgi:hypothetical protein
VTGAFTVLRLSQDSPANRAEALAIAAPGWRVTAPPPCPTTRANSPGFPRTWAARVARDRCPRRAGFGTDADAPARRRDGPAAHARDARVPASAAALPGTSLHTRAATPPPTAPGGTTAGTPCIASASSLPSPSRAQRRLPLSRQGPSPPPRWPGVDHDPAAAARRPAASVDLYPAARWITLWPALKGHAACRW